MTMYKDWNPTNDIFNIDIINNDTGSELETTIISLLNGVCNNSLCTYPTESDNFEEFQKINNDMINDSHNHKLIPTTIEKIPNEKLYTFAYIGQHYRIPLIKENLINV